MEGGGQISSLNNQSLGCDLSTSCGTAVGRQLKAVVCCERTFSFVFADFETLNVLFGNNDRSGASQGIF